MRVLVLCPHFAPDTAPTGTVMTAIVDGWAAAGHEVHVVTSLPWYREHRVEREWRRRPVRTERTPWGSVRRVHPFPTDKTNIPARAAGFAGLTSLMTLGAVFRRVRADVVFAMSPPLTLGLAGWVVARIRRVPYVFNVQDVFPDVASELGVMTNRRLVGLCRWLERFSYRRSDAVTVLSDDLRDNLVVKLGPADGNRLVRVIPNFVDVARIQPAPRSEEPGSYRHEHGLVAKTVVMYAGNVGFSQSLGLVVDAAHHFAAAGRRDVVFVINGGGSARADLERDAAGLDNLVFVDFQPAERLAEVLAAADIHLVTLRTGLAKSSVPSKFYSILASGRPVIASVDAQSELARIVERSGCGLAVPPDDPGALIDAVGALADDAAARRRAGAAGRAVVEEWMSAPAVAQAYVELFESVGARSRPGRLRRRR